MAEIITSVNKALIFLPGEPSGLISILCAVRIKAASSYVKEISSQPNRDVIEGNLLDKQDSPSYSSLQRKAGTVRIHV
jgi:hypothetical protein